MKYITLFVISFILLVSCACNREGRHIITPKELNEMKRADIIADRLTDNFSKKMYENKGLVTIGTGGGGPGKLRMLAVDFECYQEMNISHARKLLLECVDGFLVEINKNPELKPFLREFPFTFKNVCIDIVFVKKDDRIFVDHPSIAATGIKEGRIDYTTYVNERLITIKEETYEEALKIVEQESKSSDA